MKENLLLTFQDAIASLPSGKSPSVLLANGFSQAWNRDIFNYANLLAAANFGVREPIIRKLFENLETYDFEVVSKYLAAAEAVLLAYDEKNAFIEQFKSDRALLRDSLITAISNTHPNLPSEISDEQYIAVRTFLSKFGNVFSTNYDLLFYWARNKRNLNPMTYITDDGFRTEQCWKGYKTRQNVFFLHGALHIYDTGSYVKKHVFTDYGSSIIEQVRSNLQVGNFPLFVSEPTWQKKKQKIDHNPYLNFCFRALGDLEGALFILGHSMDENDRHIFTQIKTSNVSKIFVSIFGNEHSDANLRTKANAQTFLGKHDLSVEFFSAESAQIWV